MKNFTLISVNTINQRIFWLLILLVLSLNGFSQNVGINATGAAPNNAAGLDVDFPDKGILIPRVALTGTANFAPLASHVAGMIVYNTVTTGDVKPGFYYNNGTKWNPGFLEGTTAGDMLYWNGTSWVMVPVGLPGQYLQVSGANIPTWGGASIATLSTNAVTAITDNSATSGGNITADGGSAVLIRGICWSTTPGPTIADTKTSDGSGIGSFVSNITGLTLGATYYVRAYTINSTAISYGNEVSFTTIGVIPTLAATPAASAIGPRTAISGGNVTTTGGSAISERGICYATTTGPTTTDLKITDPSPGLGSFVSNLTGLSASTTYYVRSYAINASGTAYGTEISFTTLAPIAPVLAATTAPSAITLTSATSGGNVTSDGGSLITERGVCYGITTGPTTAGLKIADGAPGTGSFVSNLSGLLAGTVYYVRAYAINSIGTSYGTQILFTTFSGAPTLVTVVATGITGASAASGGSMNWNGGGYSNFDDYGVAYSLISASATPTYVATNTANGSVNPLVPIGPWVTNLSGLAANTTYYIRSYLNLFRSSTSTWITVYGPELSFSTVGSTPPVVASTTAITGILASSANSGGNITSNGGSALTAKGVCWSTSPTPTLGVNNFTNVGTTTGTFTSTITGLTGSTLYYVRAYATNSNGTSYGPTDVTFTTCVTPAYNLGEYVGGGVVFYVNCDGTGLIASLSDQPTTAVWGCSGTNIGTSAALGTGAANTAAILAGCLTRPIAASVASSCTDGGYNDWYLPSAAELGLLITSNRIFPPFPGPSYYCSSTDGTSTSTASGYYYANNWQVANLAKTTQFYVRAIRSFGAPTLPAVTTDAITNIGAGSATGGGNVTSDGGSSILAAGVCWSTTTGPTIANSITTDAMATGAFVSNISGLTLATTYYVRAYVTTVAGTAYGSEFNFMTAASASAPTVTTDAVTSLSGTDAAGGGNVTSDGGDAVTAYGVCWSTSPTPTTADFTTTDGSGTGAFVSSLASLTSGTTYYVRAYATNGIGTSYGNEVSFISGGLTVIADGTSIISAGSIASIYSYVSNDAGDPVTETGICWSTTAVPTIAGNHSVDPMAQYNFYGELINLTVGNTYYVRAYAINSAGLAYSNEVSFVATAATVGQNLIFNSGYDGIVISTDGNNGIIATAWDFGVSDWACASFSTGATGTAVGTGLSNTNSILADITLNNCVSASPNSWYGLFAAELPSIVIGPGWYLPSKDEVDLIYSTSGTTNLPLTGLQLWSSSEIDATHSWFYDGSVWQSVLKTDDTKTIWPIRSF